MNDNAQTKPDRAPPLARDRWLGAVRAYGIHDRPDNKHRRHG